jgi:hypothetical protein
MTTTSDKRPDLRDVLTEMGIPIPTPSPETKRRSRALYESLREPGDPPLPSAEDEDEEGPTA